jgi:hypothetical protein
MLKKAYRQAIKRVLTALTMNYYAVFFLFFLGDPRSVLGASASRSFSWSGSAQRVHVPTHSRKKICSPRRRGLIEERREKIKDVISSA